VKDKRQTPRAPILTQVEAQGDVATALGHARDISVGGMLIETPETLAEGATVIVRFFIPPDPKPIQAAGRIVRVQDGKSMGIAFMGLRTSDQHRVVEYIKSIQEVSEELQALGPQEGTSALRRSARIHRRVPVQLSWQDEEGRTQQEAGETHLLSRHGALLLTFSELQPGQLARLGAPEGRHAVARVVWVKPAQMVGRMEVGIEILGIENFWGMEFAPHRAGYVGKRDRRRSPRLPQKTAVVLSWTDEHGRQREEGAETILLSRYGTLVRSPVALPVEQRLRLRVPETKNEAEAEVIWLQEGEAPEHNELGIEFLEAENFWEIDFPADEEQPSGSD